MGVGADEKKTELPPYSCGIELHEHVLIEPDH